MLDDFLDVKYATIYNLYSPKAKREDGAILAVGNKRDKYIKLGYIKPLCFGNQDTRQSIFYSITEEGARAADRFEDFKNYERKSDASLNHEFCKIDVAMAFKRLYGVRDFDYTYKINKSVKDRFGKIKTEKHTPDIFFRIGKYKYLAEIELKDRPDKVIDNIKHSYTEKNPDYRVLVVYIPWEYKRRRYIFRRPQSYTEEMLKIADMEMQKLLKHKRFAELQPFVRVMHFIDFYCLNEPVWYRPDGVRTKLIN